MDGFDSFAKEIADKKDSETSDSEEDKKKPTVEINKDSEFSSLY